LPVPRRLPGPRPLPAGPPPEREVPPPPRRQGGGRHAERKRGVHLCARRAHRRNHADQQAESNRSHEAFYFIDRLAAFTAASTSARSSRVSRLPMTLTSLTVPLLSPMY